ncbi:hypothetical protein [Nostoc sp. CHAB 5715]|uniref:hypothetical protein n=1 Tax=Nostoc sp. CHAB 5715 TaxID=2780400 RepID=UPI001E46FCBE|nr:hypothetical protein [Nostoc sp. CHAB 5715]MCC5621123.1 hypothetical protein [Nostoc sp. CHAB 5715]
MPAAGYAGVKNISKMDYNLRDERVRGAIALIPSLVLFSAKLAYSYFQVNRPRGRGTAMLCPYDRCGSNT